MTFLLDRLARLHAARRRAEGLSEAQRVALDYLARANRFSRSPSVVADYLATTRGTASQTLKALAEKGLIAEAADAGDRRQRRYDLTGKGREMVAAMAGWLPPRGDRGPLLTAIRTVLRAAVEQGDGVRFGICRGCRHHEERPGGPPRCRLLQLELTLEEPAQLCHEFAEAG